MCADDATRRGGGSRTVPVDALPDPVLGYRRQDESLVVADRNEAFTEAFDAVPAETTVREWLRSATDAEDRTVGDVCSALGDGDAVDTTVPRRRETADCAETYRLRTLADDGATDVDGFLLLTEATSTDQSDVEVDRIASVISHDLRNPLDVANIHLRAARETGDPEHFDQVRQSHDRMERIIQDVLTLARGQHVLNITADIDVESVATDAWSTVETDSASLAVAGDLPTTDADPDRLQRLFENLFRNAVEHGWTGDAQARRDAADPTDEGAATDGSGDDKTHSERGIEVRVGRADGGFFVADDGVGISPAERERVFDPGYSAADSGDGTGLGLTIVERIAEAHGWTVSLMSGDGGGARFEFRPASEEP